MNFRSFLWFVGRPNLYPEMVRRLGSSLVHERTPRSRREAQKKLSAAWCVSIATRREDVLRAIGFQGSFTTAAELHPEIWRRAEAASSACSVTMGGPGDVDLLYHLCLHLQAERVVETGVAYGWSSLAILLALEHQHKGSLASSDMPYALRKNDRFVGCVVPAELRGRWKLHRLPDRDVLPGLLRQWPVIDLAHYDSDKAERGRWYGYTRLWEALRPGGFLVSDDIQDNLAFKDFAEHAGSTPWVYGSRDGGYVGILRK